MPIIPQYQNIHRKMFIGPNLHTMPQVRTYIKQMQEQQKSNDYLPYNMHSY